MPTAQKASLSPTATDPRTGPLLTGTAPVPNGIFVRSGDSGPLTVRLWRRYIVRGVGAGSDTASACSGPGTDCALGAQPATITSSAVA